MTSPEWPPSRPSSQDLVDLLKMPTCFGPGPQDFRQPLGVRPVRQGDRLEFGIWWESALE
jgi:hypothetical protein